MTLYKHRDNIGYCSRRGCEHTATAHVDGEPVCNCHNIYGPKPCSACQGASAIVAARSAATCRASENMMERSQGERDSRGAWRRDICDMCRINEGVHPYHMIYGDIVRICDRCHSSTPRMTI